ncbi:MAG: hypothetical protein WA810_05715 [Maribacter sp.]
MANGVTQKNKLKRNWLLLGGFGTLLVGTGISLAIESGFLKHEGAVWWQWASAGTGALSLVIVGIILLIKAAFVEQRLKQ